MAEDIFTAKLGEVKGRERLPHKDWRRHVDRNPGDVKTKNGEVARMFHRSLACLLGDVLMKSRTTE
jgi:hypothetical protein